MYKLGTSDIKENQPIYFVTFVLASVSIVPLTPLMLICLNLYVHSHYPFPNVDYDSICPDNDNINIYSWSKITFIMIAINLFCFLGSANASYVQRLILIFDGTVFGVDNKSKSKLIMSLGIYIAVTFIFGGITIVATVNDEILLRSICMVIIFLSFLIESGYVCYSLVTRLVYFVKFIRNQIYEEYKSTLMIQNRISNINNCKKTINKSAKCANNININMAINDKPVHATNDDNTCTQKDWKKNDNMNPDSIMELSGIGSVFVPVIFEKQLEAKLCQQVIPLFDQTRKLTILSVIGFVSTILDIIMFGIFRVLVNERDVNVFLSICAISFDVAISFVCLTLQFAFFKIIYDKTLKIFEKLPMFTKLEATLTPTFFIKSIAINQLPNVNINNCNDK